MEHTSWIGALAIGLTACVPVAAGRMEKLVLLCPGDRTVQVSFLQRGVGVLIESGADHLVLPRVPATTGEVYSDGRAALWLGVDTALMSVTSESLKVMTCWVEVVHARTLAVPDDTR